MKISKLFIGSLAALFLTACVTAAPGPAGPRGEPGSTGATGSTGADGIQGQRGRTNTDTILIVPDR